jgi:hypothetical protein
LSVEELDRVDVASIDRETGHVVLTISDHLDWHDSLGHQTTLQKKFNTYLAFVESGEILERYPMSKGRQVTFKVVFQHAPDADAEQFLRKAKEVIEAAGLSLRSEVFKPCCSDVRP